MNTKSAVKTAIVLLAVPFSLVGAFWFLNLLGYNMSVAVWVGLIALAGLDAETGVVMHLYLDHAWDKFRSAGRMNSMTDLRAAVVEGAVQRIRPKIMTICAILFGLLPIMSKTVTAGAHVICKYRWTPRTRPQAVISARACQKAGRHHVTYCKWKNRITATIHAQCEAVRGRNGRGHRALEFGFKEARAEDEQVEQRERGDDHQHQHQQDDLLPIRMKKYPSGMVSAVELKPEGGQQRSAAERAGSITHGRHAMRHGDFAVTDRRSVFAVHACRVRAALRPVRTVQPTQPISAAGARLSQGFTEVLAARLLGSGLVEAGGNPGVGSPAVITAFEVLEVPAPLDYGLAGRKHTDESERIHAGEG